MTHKGKLALIEFEEIVEGGWSPEPTVSEFRDILAYVDELEKANEEIQVANIRLVDNSEQLRNAALEEAAIKAVIHSQYPVENDYDRGYGQGRKDAAAAIRNLKST